MLPDKLGDAWNGREKIPCELRMGSLPDHDEQPRLVADDGGAFIRFVPDPRVVADRNPTLLGHGFQPNIVWAIVREMISMAPDRQSRRSENIRKLCA